MNEDRDWGNRYREVAEVAEGAEGGVAAFFILRLSAEGSGTLCHSAMRRDCPPVPIILIHFPRP